MKKFLQLPLGVHVLITAYVLCVVLANVTLNNFVTLPGYGLLSIGTLFFAAIFTLRDRIHAAGGLFPVYCAIALAVAVNVITSYLTDTPWRFITASFLSILCSELADTAIFHRMRKWGWGARVLSSNAVSVPLDSVLFAILAFYGDMTNHEILQIIYADIIVKYAISMLLIVRWHLIGRERGAVA